MTTTYKLATNYFYGNKASDYAIENGFLDYATFAKSLITFYTKKVYME